MNKPTLLLTGAAGNMGKVLREGELSRSYTLISTDIVVPSDLRADEQFIQADLGDIQQIQDLTEKHNINGILHFGGFATESSVQRDFAAAAQVNVVATKNLLDASVKTGVSRLIFPSTLHVYGGYATGATLSDDAPAKTNGMYAATKLMCENLCNMYSDSAENFGTFIIRVGSCFPEPKWQKHMQTWLHPDDLTSLIKIGLEHPDAGGQTVFGISKNTQALFANAAAYALGYAPQHDAEDYAAKIPANGETFSTIGAKFTEEFDEYIAQLERNEQLACA